MKIAAVWIQLADCSKGLTTALKNRWLCVFHETNIVRGQSTAITTFLLRWLKPVSTLERNVLIRRIDTTTLYHLTGLFWYHIKHQLLLKRFSRFCNVKSYHGNGQALQNTVKFGLAAPISKTNLVNPIFYL